MYVFMNVDIFVPSEVLQDINQSIQLAFSSEMQLL